HHGRGAACEREHVVVHVDADHTAPGSHDLRRDEADLAATAAEVEHDVSLAHVARGIAAAVVALDHLLGDGAQVARIVVDGTAEARLACLRGVAVALAYGRLHGDLLESGRVARAHGFFAGSFCTASRACITLSFGLTLMPPTVAAIVPSGLMT